MPFLLHVSFDNNCRLQRKHYLFEYAGIRFKLIQNNPRKWRDVLLTILPSSNNQTKFENAYKTASEFLSALSWKNRAIIMMSPGGGAGVPEGYKIGRAQCYCFDLPRIPLALNLGGKFDIQPIPKIETEEQSIALTLFREALSSNNYFLSFLFYWQVIEIAGNKTKPQDWINKTLRKNRSKLRLSSDEISRLPLGQKTLGHYLLDDCRDAIAHIRRKPGKKRLLLDDGTDRRRLVMSTLVVKGFAEFYIKDVLKLEDCLYLVRETKRGFPVYVDRNYYETHHCFPAYLSYR